MSKEIAWRRVLVEGVVIVASILLAFGADAWWAERGERGTERTELVRIRDELVVDRSRVQRSSENQARRAAASLSVVEIISGPDGASGTVEVSDSLLALTVQAGTFEARTPALDGLRQSGRVEIIRAAEVRAALATWDRAMVNVSEFEADARRFVYDQLVPALIERGDMGNVLRNATRVGLGGTTRLRADLELNGLMSQRYFMVNFASRALAGSVTALDELVTAIERALEP